MDNLNNDELGTIFSFIPPQDLINSVQLVSNNFHQIVTTQTMLWKKYCDEYYLADLFDWEHDLFTKSLQIDEESKYFTLFNEWSRSIPRIELVGRYPTLSKYNGGAEHERSVFSRFDTSKYSFRNLTQLIILLNVFSLTKYGNEFNSDDCQDDDDSEGIDYPYDEQFVNAKFTPYDFVPSIWGDSVTITLSDRYGDQFTYGNAMVKESDDEESLPIVKVMPFGAFCLMILSDNQQDNISLIRNILTESKDESLVLGVSVPNAEEDNLYPVCYFNRMQKFFDVEEACWSEDGDFGTHEIWLPTERSGFMTSYVFYENESELKKVTMERGYHYP